MNRKLRSTAVMILAPVLAALTLGRTEAQQNAVSKVAGVTVAAAYGQWTAQTTSAVASGSATISVNVGSVTTADGRTFVPFTTNVPLTIGNGADVETVTPSAVSGCTVGAAIGACQVTATFSNAHSQGEPIVSGDNGLQEAMNDTSGGGLVFWVADSGTVTLSTSGATTTLCSSCIPVNAIVLGVVARVETTITGCSGGWELGDGTTATRFTAANATLTAGTASAADLQTTSGVASTTTGMLNITSAKSIVNTCVTSNASAGALKVRAFGYVLAVPQS
jgi:hypothetical protein